MMVPTVSGRRQRDAINGWIIIDKPVGKTSAQVVNRVRHFLNARKAGHAGTLDPLASGILPIAFGEATKTIPFAMDTLKEYKFEVSWGQKRDTDDREGCIVERSDSRPDMEQIEGALPYFIGDIDQVPPNYSAIKVNGRRAYDLARNNAIEALPSRKVFVKTFKLESIIDQDHASFLVTSGKGTYVRALARDLAVRLGTVGHVSSLRRLKVGSFSEKDAISLDSLEALAHSPATFDSLLPVEVALDGIPAMSLSGEQASRMKNGHSIPLDGNSNWGCKAELEEGSLLYTISFGKPIAISRVQEGFIRPIRVLNL